jgi:hypothetical protein
MLDDASHFANGGVLGRLLGGFLVVGGSLATNHVDVRLEQADDCGRVSCVVDRDEVDVVQSRHVFGPERRPETPACPGLRSRHGQPRQ